MATKAIANQSERIIIQNALELLEQSYERRSNMKGVDSEIQQMYKSRAAQTAALRNKLINGELDV